MRAVLVAVILVLGGCLESGSVLCGDITCPPNTRCGPANECVPADCGDGLVTGLEGCDGDTDGLRCTDYGFYAGPPLTCSPICQVDTSSCVGSCGDREVNGPERCDGIPPAGFSCADFGFDVGPLNCALGCTPGFELCSSIGWQTAPGGATDELHAVWLSGPASGIAVGLNGTIVMATDGIWVPVASPTTAHLFGVAGSTGVAGSAPDRAIAVGAGGTILFYDGTSWTPMASPTMQDLYAIAGTAIDAVAVGAGGTILHFNGTAWSVASSPTTEDLFGVFVGTLQALAVGANNTVVRRQLNNWTTIPLSVPSVPVTLRSVFVIGTETFVAGDNRTALRITAGGPTELALPPGSVVPVLSVWASSPNDVYFAAGNGYLFHWDGAQVVRQDTPTDRSIFAITGLSESRVFGVTRGGGILVFNGTDHRVEQPFPAELHAVFKDASVTVVAGADLVMRHTGTGWAPLPAPGTTISSAWADGPDTWVGSGVPNSTAGVYFYDDGGTPSHPVGAGVNAIFGLTSPLRIVAVGDTVQQLAGGAWSADPTAVNGNRTLYGVWATPDGTWYAVGDGGFAMRKTATTPWTAIPAPTTERLLGVWGASANDVFAVGTKGTLVHWDGARWRAHYTGTGENLIAISGSSRGDIYVLGTSIRFHFDGVSWSRITGDLGRAVATTGAETIIAGTLGTIEWYTRASSSTEDRCSDPWDNDGDGRTNCEDDDCIDDVGDIACRAGGACPTLTRIDCATTELVASTYTGIARIDDLPCLDRSTPGPEASYRFVPGFSGLVTVTIEDPSSHLDMAVTDAVGGACNLDACTAATRAGDTLSVTFDVTVGEVYYVIIDGPVYTAEPFTLTVICPQPP